MHIGIDASRLSAREPTGVERYAEELLPPLSKALLDRGHRVTWYRRGADAPPVPGVRQRVIRIPRVWTHVGLGPASVADRVDRLFVPSHVLPVFRPARCVVVLHDACFEETPRGYALAARWYLRLTTADALRHARVVTHSRASRNAFVRVFHASAGRIRVIAPAAPPVRPLPRAPTAHAPYLLYLGRIETRKNLETLLAAFDALVARRADLRHTLLLVGKDGYGAARIRAAARRLNAAGRVIFTGYASAEGRDAALRGAAGVVLPSHCEGSSLVLLEARSARVPFAARAHGACVEAGGTGGIFVREDADSAAWARALERLMDSPIPPDPPPARTWEDVAREMADVILEAT